MKDGIIFLYVLKITVCNCNSLFFDRYLLGLPLDQGLCWRSGPYLSLGRETLIITHII